MSSYDKDISLNITVKAERSGDKNVWLEAGDLVILCSTCGKCPANNGYNLLIRSSVGNVSQTEVGVSMGVHDAVGVSNFLGFMDETQWSALLSDDGSAPSTNHHNNSNNSNNKNNHHNNNNNNSNNSNNNNNNTDTVRSNTNNPTHAAPAAAPNVTVTSANVGVCVGPAAQPIIVNGGASPAQTNTNVPHPMSHVLPGAVAVANTLQHANVLRPHNGNAPTKVTAQLEIYIPPNTVPAIDSITRANTTTTATAAKPPAPTSIFCRAFVPAAQRSLLRRALITRAASPMACPPRPRAIKPKPKLVTETLVGGVGTPAPAPVRPASGVPAAPNPVPVINVVEEVEVVSEEMIEMPATDNADDDDDGNTTMEVVVEEEEDGGVEVVENCN